MLWVRWVHWSHHRSLLASIRMAPSPPPCDRLTNIWWNKWDGSLVEPQQSACINTYVNQQNCKGYQRSHRIGTRKQLKPTKVNINLVVGWQTIIIRQSSLLEYVKYFGLNKISQNCELSCYCYWKCISYVTVSSLNYTKYYATYAKVPAPSLAANPHWWWVLLHMLHLPLYYYTMVSS